MRKYRVLFSAKSIRNVFNTLGLGVWKRKTGLLIPDAP